MDIQEKSINYLKSLTAEVISNAKSGHTGSAISASTMIFALFKDHLNFNPNNPAFLNRDRFILSAGHTCAMYYTLLHMFGYDISMDDLKKFRSYASKTPGHPELGIVPGVESSTGPLGQGVANAVGLAIAESIFESKFNDEDHKIFNNFTYCYSGDGCLMEGVAVEACSLAGTLGLNKLILLYEDNNITIDGTREMANSENTTKKFEAMGWNVIQVKDGHNYYDCTQAIQKAKSSKKPTIIIFKTIIGIGTQKQGTPKIHACPLPEEELQAFKTSLNAPESFYIPEDVYDYLQGSVSKKQIFEKMWLALMESYKISNPEKFKELQNIFKPKKVNYQKILNTLLKQNEMSGREVSGEVFNAFANYYEEFVGGSADVAASTKALIKNGGDFSIENRLGRNIHFGIREHAMGSIANGISLYAGLPVFDSTFLAFSNYMMPSIRMRSMMELPVLSIFTHDSIDVGQDGQSHQPIEQISQLRNIVGYTVFRPATIAETIAGYKTFFNSRIPMALIFSRTKMKHLGVELIEDAEKGAYVFFDTTKKPTIEIFATGKDVELAASVANELKDLGVRVISMPCESLFASQDKTYKNSVLLKNPTLKVAIEASNDLVWYKYVGENGLIFSVNSYQPSGNGTEVYEKAGFNKDNIVKQIKKKLKIK